MATAKVQRNILSSVEKSGRLDELADIDVSQLSDAERVVLARIVEEMGSSVDGSSAVLSGLFKEDYIIKPPTISEFIENDYFFGDPKVKDQWHDKWLEDLHEVFAPGSKISEWVLTGSIGTGKSTVANFGLLYQMACVACLRDPHSYFHMMPGDEIAFGLFNITKDLAYDVNFTRLSHLAGISPFFRERMKNSRSGNLVSMTNHIVVALGSGATHALGKNVLASLMDEVNFSKSGVDAIKSKRTFETYTSLARRKDSRFLNVPACSMLASSKKYTTDFVEDHIKRANPETTKVSDYAIYKMGKFKYSGRKFYVIIGDETNPSEIVPEGQPVPTNRRVEEVPIEHREPFNQDIDSAIRDVCGIHTLRGNTFLRRIDKLSKVNPDLKHPFSKEVIIIGLDDDIQVRDYFIADLVFRAVDYKQTQFALKVQPGKTRYIHVDLAKSKDCVGMACGFYSGDRVVKRTEGLLIYEETAPIVQFDFLLRIQIKRGSVMDFAKLRLFLLYLRKLGMQMEVTYDGFQSTDSIQILNRSGIKAEEFSVDRTTKPYNDLLNSHMEERVITYDYYPYKIEMQSLVISKQGRTGVREKIDHSDKNVDGTRGSKDVSDCAASVVSRIVEKFGTTSAISAEKFPRKVLVGVDEPKDDSSQNLEWLLR